MRVTVLLLSAAIALAASPGAAQVLFSQNFNSLSQGIPAASVPGFATTGTVDVVSNGNFNITCAGNAGACVDLSGTPGPGTLTTNSIAFLAGRDVKISFDLSGNQRDLSRDTFEWSVAFNPANGGTAFGDTGFAPGGFINALNGVTYQELIAGDRGFVTYSGIFNAGSNGTFTMSFRGVGGGNVNIGPILDNVSVTQGAIPEPASWAMLIAGFGLVGAVQRKRKTAILAA
jgi:hypothetical protein